MTHISAHSYDRTGHYSRALALRAGQDFHRGLRQYWLKIAIGVLALLLAALALDALTAGTGIQRRPNLHLTILFVEIMVWARYGAAVVVAAARWSPPRSPAFAQARELASGLPVARSFALTNIAFAAAALAAVAGYKWGGTLLPSARAELFCSAGSVRLPRLSGALAAVPLGALHPAAHRRTIFGRSGDAGCPAGCLS